MTGNFFENNLKAMEKWYPDFAELIREDKYESDDTKIQVEKSWDGKVIFRIKRQGVDLYLGGKRNATKPVKMWQERMGKIHKYAPIFLFGLGSGEYLKSLVENSPKEANIVVYEPSVNIFLEALREVDLSETIQDRPIAFVIEGLNGEEFEAVMGKVLALETMEYFKEEVYPNYKRAFQTQVMEKIKLVHKTTEMIIVNFRTNQYFRAQLAQNVLYNLPYITEGYSTMQLAKAVSHEGAAIVVSAGPSLNRNIKELHRAKNHLFIIAVDTAVKPLLKEGIRPDAFLTLDAQKPLELLEIDGADTIPVIAPSAARYGMLDQQKGKKIFCSDGYLLPIMLYAENGKELPYVSVGGSVACGCFSLLYKMGFETVILVGQDLAYTNNKSHADGTFQEKMPTEDTSRMIMVKGNYEEKVPTIVELKLYLEWFCSYIKGAKEHGNFRVINATEGGAYIEGTELMTLKEALDECIGEEIDFSAQIENMESAFSDKEREKARNSLEKIPEEFKEIGKIAKQLKREYKKIEKQSRSGNDTREGYNKSLKRIRKLTEKCQAYAGYQLIETTLQRAAYIFRTELYYDQDDLVKQNEILEAAKHGMKYSDIMSDCATLMKEMSEQMLKRKVQIEEEEKQKQMKEGQVKC